MKLFCNSYSQFSAVKYFRKKALSKMFHGVLNRWLKSSRELGKTKVTQGSISNG